MGPAVEIHYRTGLNTFLRSGEKSGEGNEIGLEEEGGGRVFKRRNSHNHMDGKKPYHRCDEGRNNQSFSGQLCSDSLTLLAGSCNLD
jgi:hypothetical protein